MLSGEEKDPLFGTEEAASGERMVLAPSLLVASPTATSALVRKQSGKRFKEHSDLIAMPDLCLQGASWHRKARPSILVDAIQAPGLAARVMDRSSPQIALVFSRKGPFACPVHHASAVED